MCVPRQFLPILTRINEVKPQFRVKHGGYVNASDVLHHSMEQRMEYVLNDPMMRLLQYVHERKLRLADLFFQFDTDRSMTISEAEFVAGIKVFCDLPWGFGFDHVISTVTFISRMLLDKTNKAFFWMSLI